MTITSPIANDPTQPWPKLPPSMNYAQVRAAMNQINANRRLRMAAQHKAEAGKIEMVKRAVGQIICNFGAMVFYSLSQAFFLPSFQEAIAESRYLSGVGVANQRRAIVHGLKESVAEFSGKVQGISSKDVMTLLLTTQYFGLQFTWF
jgi:hypothetical protein